MIRLFIYLLSFYFIFVVCHNLALKLYFYFQWFRNSNYVLCFLVVLMAGYITYNWIYSKFCSSKESNDK